MRIITDTNLLLRFVVSDDPLQYKLALKIMEQAEAVVVTNAAPCDSPTV